MSTALVCPDMLYNVDSTGAVAGTTAVNGSTLDMSGFNELIAEALLGALTATQVTKLKLQVGNAANGSDMADVVGATTLAAADADSNKLLILDCGPTSFIGFRYARVVLVRGTANAVLVSLVTRRYKAKNVPQVQAAAQVSQLGLIH